MPKWDLSGALTSEDKFAYDQSNIRIKSGQYCEVQTEELCSRNITPDSGKKSVAEKEQQEEHEEKEEDSEKDEEETNEAEEKEKEGKEEERVSASARSSVDDCTTFHGYGRGVSWRVPRNGGRGDSSSPIAPLSLSLLGQIR